MIPSSRSPRARVLRPFVVKHFSPTIARGGRERRIVAIAYTADTLREAEWWSARARAEVLKAPGLSPAYACLWIERRGAPATLSPVRRAFRDYANLSVTRA